MKVEVVSIGDELLLAEILDTNAAYITRCLRELGLELTARVTVGDVLAQIAGALATGLERADVVISSGGLGMQSNDYTRQAAADITGRNLTSEPPGVSQGQALGSPAAAQGLLLDTEQGTLICLPGNQRDMSYLVQTEVLPYLRQRLPGDEAMGWIVFRTAGIMESNVRELLDGIDLQPGQLLTYTSYAGQTDIRLLIKAETDPAVATALERLSAEIESRLGDHIYGRDRERLEQVTVQALERHNLQVAVAEHNTGGSIAQAMHHIPDVNKTFTFLPLTTHDGISHYLEIETLRESGDVTRWCRLAAGGLRQKMEADLGLVVYKNATPGGVQLLITLAAPNGVSFAQRSFGGHPGNIDHWAGTLGLVHLRRWLLAHGSQ